MAAIAWPERLLIVGCGNMGGAMLAGWLAIGLDPLRITVVDPVLAEAPAGVTLLRGLPAKTGFDAVLLAVKPLAAVIVHWLLATDPMGLVAPLT